MTKLSPIEIRDALRAVLNAAPKAPGIIIGDYLVCRPLVFEYSERKVSPHLVEFFREAKSLGEEIIPASRGLIVEEGMFCAICSHCDANHLTLLEAAERA